MFCLCIRFLHYSVIVFRMSLIALPLLWSTPSGRLVLIFVCAFLTLSFDPRLNLMRSLLMRLLRRFTSLPDFLPAYTGTKTVTSRVVGLSIRQLGGNLLSLPAGSLSERFPICSLFWVLCVSCAFPEILCCRYFWTA